MGRSESVFCVSGSSPLARGLLLILLSALALCRIIPARAGFTKRWGSPTILLPDHPRSRGVYVSRRGDVRAHQGSSPLARGLPPVVRRPRRGRRIIPARAGFTTTSGRCRRWRQDHPRSRGVYPHRGAMALNRSGSSPLARGLRRRRPRIWGPGRIIPARAGFTRRAGSALALLRDHPRSRGVYNLPVSAQRTARGSSPLARGLLGDVDAEQRARRIIPARAGFT